MESGKFTRNRMIHIRLDEETHRQLKIHAAQTGASIQQLVEEMIRLKFVESSTDDVKL